MKEFYTGIIIFFTLLILGMGAILFIPIVVHATEQVKSKQIQQAPKLSEVYSELSDLYTLKELIANPSTHKLNIYVDQEMVDFDLGPDRGWIVSIIDKQILKVKTARHLK